MCEGCVEKPLYLLIAEWMMAENRWVIVRIFMKGDHSITSIEIG